MRLLALKNEYLKGNHRRDRISIIAEILAKTNIARNKTAILQHCNLNHKQLKSYTELLLEKKLLKIEVDEKGQEKFLTTPKGKDFIKTFSNLIGSSIPYSKISSKTLFKSARKRNLSRSGSQ